MAFPQFGGKGPVLLVPGSFKPMRLFCSVSHLLFSLLPTKSSIPIHLHVSLFFTYCTLCEIQQKKCKDEKKKKKAAPDLLFSQHTTIPNSQPGDGHQATALVQTQ